MGLVPADLVASQDSTEHRWVPSHKHTLSVLSAATTDGDGSSSSGEEFETYSGLGAMDDPYMYPSPWIVKNTFIDLESIKPDHVDREARSCPVSKLHVSTGSSSIVVDDVITEEEVDVHRDASIFPGSVPFKNTFVHFPDEKPHFILERETKSCPPSWVDGTGGECGTSEEKVAEVFTSYASQDDDMFFPQAQAPMLGGSWTTYTHTVFVSNAPALPCAHQQVVPEMQQSIQESLRVVLSLASALPNEATKLEEVPTVGSAGHWNGTCKPCAFMVRGCTSGESCPFCHLCDPSEKKRRKKEKVAVLRELRRLKKGGSGATHDQHQ